jgi:hypothetical protein
MLSVSRQLYRSKIRLPENIVVCPHCGTVLRDVGFSKGLWYVAAMTVAAFVFVLLFQRRITAMIGIKAFDSFFEFFLTVMVLGVLTMGLRRTRRYEKVDNPQEIASLSNRS